ncbi:YqhA family protein [Labrenzia sp. PHM005]|uniref:YqhA family protein n=1 Tax=Labrenzia sp. PHM005 TaxID=2590016 RepID=UPI00143CCA53|nr:YqhA family protein [Labrenzia sp. PHM005]
MLEVVSRGTRYVSLVMVLTSFVGAIALTFIGAEKMFRGIWDYFTRAMPANVIEAAGPSDLFIVRALESLDAFLIAFALFTFGNGILFLVVLSPQTEKDHVPEVLIPTSIGALKTSLMQVVIVVLAVYFVRVAWLEIEDLDFKLWAIPGSILFLAASMWLSKAATQNK